ncbi:MAG: hypothetical protein HKN62_18880 [Phycisphaerales bacterium]|nr:hypothetical protein [Phycisphaerales bacterium]
MTGFGVVFSGTVMVEGVPRPVAAPAADAVILPGVYTGTASCAECHRDEPEDVRGQTIGDENRIWSQSDPHSHGYKTLENDASKAIAEKMQIATPTESDRCLSCHAPTVPANMLHPEHFETGKAWKTREGIGCEMCHGPAGDWLEPHADENWTPTERKNRGAAGLLSEYKLIDTTHLPTRAEKCVSCHLKIDPEMVKAGHPPLEFELFAYSAYLWDEDYEMHWDEAAGDAALWAAGQAAAAKAATAQVQAWKNAGADATTAESLAAIYEKGKPIASKVTQQSFAPAACATAARELAAVGKTATNGLEMNIVGYGVSALGATALAGNEEAVDAFNDVAYELEEMVAEFDEQRAKRDELLEKMVAKFNEQRAKMVELLEKMATMAAGSAP